MIILTQMIFAWVWFSYQGFLSDILTWVTCNFDRWNFMGEEVQSHVQNLFTRFVMSVFGLQEMCRSSNLWVLCVWMGYKNSTFLQWAETDDVRFKAKGTIEAVIGAKSNLYGLCCIMLLNKFWKDLTDNFHGDAS